MRSALSKRVAVRSFAKINLGLYIGALRADGFHDLRTVYQTIALHDVIRVSVARGSGIEILCTNRDPRVPLDSSNTCYRMAARVMEELRAKGRVSIEIEKRLPVQGGLGAASSNAVATMIGLERALKKRLSVPVRLRIAAEIGSDLPLFLVGGTALGVGRGEEVYPLADLPSLPMVVVVPYLGVSTARAFADWDALASRKSDVSQLTSSLASDRLSEVGCALSAWLTGFIDSGTPNTGASAKGGSRAGKLLSDLVRTGIENDFEQVVFSQYPELRDIKGALERAGAKYASLSGSGSTLYGLFGSSADAAKAARRLQSDGFTAIATSTLTRQNYWRKVADR
jgi:4-diphosphocytidyl-2-C-methyl-D-erythritol kinase